MQEQTTDVVNSNSIQYTVYFMYVFYEAYQKCNPFHLNL